VAERLREAVARVGSTSAVSASIGVTVVGPDENVHDLLCRADAAMYRAKAHGGNAIAAHA
jgi:GGDEF domain-containing protein